MKRDANSETMGGCETGVKAHTSNATVEGHRDALHSDHMTKLIVIKI